MMAQKRFADAQDTYLHGICYLLWVKRSSEYLPPSTSDQRFKAAATYGKSLVARAHSLFALGDLRGARDYALYQNDEVAPLFPAQIIAGSSYQSLLYLAGSADNMAAYEFTKVLRLQPGHEGADRELDAIEKRVLTLPYNEDRFKVIQNLAHPISAYRHKDTKDAQRTVNLIEDYMFNFEITRIPATRN